MMLRFGGKRYAGVTRRGVAADTDTEHGRHLADAAASLKGEAARCLPRCGAGVACQWGRACMSEKAHKNIP